MMDEAEHRTYYDKVGNQFRVVGCLTEDFSSVLDMYDTFMPEPVAQGLPPADRQIRHTWLHSLLEQGENFAVVKQEKVVGHASLMPSVTEKEGEYLIFVATPERNKGLATVLTLVVIEQAYKMGMDSIWLTVESDNFRAIKLYRKMGFQFRDKGLSERMMALRLGD